MFDVDAAFDGATFFGGLESSVPVVAITRSGDAVTLRFTGDYVPEEVLLFRRRRACGRCDLFGHATVTCSRNPRCLQCAGRHPTSSCTVERHRCLHCGGPHAATEPRCPQWQLERKIAASLASSKPRITRNQALELALGSGSAAPKATKQRPDGQRAPKLQPGSSQLQPGLSYSAALTGGTRAGSSIRGGAGEPPATDNPAQPPGTTPPVPNELVVTAFASALRSLLELVPADSPAPHMCVAALAMHDALGGLFGHITECARAATTRCVGTPVPDIKQPNLRAVRRRAQRVAMRTGRKQHWTVYNRLDAVCRRHAPQCQLVQPVFLVGQCDRSLAPVAHPKRRTASPCTALPRTFHRAAKRPTGGILQPHPHPRRELMAPRRYFPSAGTLAEIDTLRRQEDEGFSIGDFYGKGGGGTQLEASPTAAQRMRRRVFRDKSWLRMWTIHPRTDTKVTGYPAD
ncbi:hypothetical protein HPB49_003367 [Dermacentor silvarum]|uniref:Uncharacterized protein n=1 Tax=Dermacentor silvarum TaxID=543639 RepID=A0ACB8CD39_DERSI|nr:hypothetical protein HPB49_003367 [Dermacentor silvarum]